jgi:hypothetical protein
MKGADIAGFSCLLALTSTVGGAIGGSVLVGVLLDRAAVAANPDERCGMFGFVYLAQLFAGGVAGAVVGVIGGIFLSLAVAALGTLKGYEQK